MTVADKSTKEEDCPPHPEYGSWLMRLVWDAFAQNSPKPSPTVYVHMPYVPEQDLTCAECGRRLVALIRRLQDTGTTLGLCLRCVERERAR